MESRLKKYKTFAPQPDKWGHDKRKYEDATKGLEVLVAKNFSKLALPCIAIYPDMDIKTGTFRGFKVAAPDGPLKEHFDNEEVKGVYFKLLRDATIDAVTKKNRKLAGEEVEASCSVVKAVGVSKPVRPIWSLTLKELEAFFSNMKTEIAKDDGVKLKPKWPKIVNAVCVKTPTKIPTFDDVVETILPSSMYVPFQKFSLGNLHWRLKLVCAYLFMKKGLDINTFAEEIPENYSPVEFDMDYIVECSDNIVESAEEHHNRKPRKNKPDVAAEAVRFPWDDDDDDDAERPEPPRQPAGHRAQPPGPSSPPAPGPAGACSGSRTMPVSVIQRQKKTQSQLSVATTPSVECFFDIDEDDIFNDSNSTGTPLNSSIGKQNDEMANIRVTRQMSKQRSEGR